MSNRLLVSKLFATLVLGLAMTSGIIWAVHLIQKMQGDSIAQVFGVIPLLIIGGYNLGMAILWYRFIKSTTKQLTVIMVLGEVVLILSIVGDGIPRITGNNLFWNQHEGLFVGLIFLTLGIVYLCNQKLLDILKGNRQ